MYYKDYKVSRDLAWQILIDNNVTQLPVRVTSLCRSMGIDIRLCELPSDNGGKSTIIDGRPIILINKADSIARQRFSAAHELGHILLGHVGRYKLVNREPDTHDNLIEQAANVFAARLLAPACVLYEIGADTPEKISQACNISITAATFRHKRMQILLQRNKFYTSPLEKQVKKQFKNYIRSNKL